MTQQITHTATEGPFARAVREILPAAEVNGPVELRRVTRGASARIGTHPSGEGFLLTYGARLDDAPPQVRHWVAAHELAHAHLGHTAPRQPMHRVALVLIFASLMSFFLTAVVLLGAVRPGTFDALFTCVAVAAVPLFVSMAAMAVVRAALQLPREHDADSRATSLAGPLEDADRDWKARHDGRGNLAPRRPGRAPLHEWLPMWARTHPRWRDRGRQVATVETA